MTPVLAHRLTCDPAGVGYTPKFLRAQIKELKDGLNDKSAPFGVDLLLPQVGGTARKTNKDYTGGQLNELIDVIIEEKAALFISAVGVPPKEVIDRLHKAKIPVMNMWVPVGDVQCIVLATAESSCPGSGPPSMPSRPASSV